MSAISAPRAKGSAPHGRAISSPLRAWLRPSTADAVLAAGLLVGVLLAYVLVRHGVKLALLGVAAPAVLFWVVRRQGNGFLLLVVVMLTIPDWYAHVWLVPPIVAGAGLLRGVVRTRLRFVDAAFFALVAVTVASWAFHRDVGVSSKVALESILPFGYYLWSRTALTEELLDRLRWVLLAAATVGALTVIYEAVHGSAVFQPPQLYQWEGSTTSIFRPGGVFGGSPTAATCLALALLPSLSLVRQRPKLAGAPAVLIIAAIILTFDRAGLLALIGGLAVLALLLPYRHWGRVAFAALAVGTLVYALISSTAVSSLSSSRLIQEGVIRSSTISQRFTLASLALDAIPATPQGLAFGRGFDALNVPPGRVSASVAAIPLLSQSGGANDDYLTILIEQGAFGLGLTLLWLGGSLWLGVRTCWRLPAGSDRRMLTAGFTAAMLGYVVAMSGHDAGHSWPMLTMGVFTSGILVSLCSLPSGSRTHEALSPIQSSSACSQGLR